MEDDWVVEAGQLEKHEHVALVQPARLLQLLQLHQALQGEAVQPGRAGEEAAFVLAQRPLRALQGAALLLAQLAHPPASKSIRT